MRQFLILGIILRQEENLEHLHPGKVDLFQANLETQVGPGTVLADSWHLAYLGFVTICIKI